MGTRHGEMRATLRTLRVLASPSARSYNRAYLATVLRTSAQIPLRGTSDTLKRCTEIARFARYFRTSGEMGVSDLTKGEENNVRLQRLSTL